jgi:hypothetical protein
MQALSGPLLEVHFSPYFCLYMKGKSYRKCKKRICRGKVLEKNKGVGHDVTRPPPLVPIFPRYRYNAKSQYRKFETNIPRKGLRGHSPNFHIHVSLSDLHVYSHNQSVCLFFCCMKICGPILGIYKSLTVTFFCGINTEK